LGIGDWGPIPNPQSPIPNPQSPLKMEFIFFIEKIFIIKQIINKDNFLTTFI